MPYGHASIPTNIGQWGPSNKLGTYHFGCFLISKQTQKQAGSCNTLYTAKSNAVLNTQLSLILHLCPLPAWQYMLSATQPSMNQQTVSSLHHRARTPAHRFLKRTTKYVLNHKMIHCSTYTHPNPRPTLAGRLALCKGIHSNKYPTLKFSQPTPNIPLHHLSKHSPKPKTRRFLSHTLHYFARD